MKTFTYGSKQIRMNKGTIIESNSEAFPIGSKITAKVLRDCGWMAEKKPKAYFANGTTSGNRFSN